MNKIELYDFNACDVIEEHYNIKVPEYGIKEENKEIVYRDYF